MRSPYNLAAGPRRYANHVRWVFEVLSEGLNVHICTAESEKYATQVADALELVDRMRNHQ